jgi:hypothetical protein
MLLQVSFLASLDDNLNHTDYVSVVLQSVGNVSLLRDFFLSPDNYESSLPVSPRNPFRRIRKIWSKILKTRSVHMKSYSKFRSLVTSGSVMALKMIRWPFIIEDQFNRMALERKMNKKKKNEKNFVGNVSGTIRVNTGRCDGVQHKITITFRYLTLDCTTHHFQKMHQALISFLKWRSTQHEKCGKKRWT